MKDLFGNDTPYPDKQQEHRKKYPRYPDNKLSSPNPMVVAYGCMEGKKCKTCEHLIGIGYSKIYYKCKYRG